MSMPRQRPRSTRHIDIQVGACVRLRRLSRGGRQEELARAIGKGSRQVEKYERGRNRIAVSVLFDIAEALGVPVDYFFAEIGNNPSSLPHQRMMLHTLHNFGAIRDARQRELFCELAESMVPPPLLEVVKEPGSLVLELEVA